MDIPASVVQEIVKEETKDGSVILVFCDDLIGESKDKLLVIVSKSTCGTKFGCILINSDDYPYLNNSHYLRSLQLTASVQKYPGFLKANSFFDCSDIKQRSIDEVLAILQKDPKRMRGVIDSDDHRKICSALQINRTISPKTKKLYYLID